MKLHNPLLTPHHPEHSLLPSLASFSLKSLPSDYASLSAWRNYYLDTSTNPLHPALLFCGAISMIVWLLGEVTGTSFLFPPSTFPIAPLRRCASS